MPTSLVGQMKLHVGAYVFGAVMLATFQFSMNRIDWLSKAAIDLIFGQNPVGSWRPAAMMLGLAVVAFITRVSSRWLIFNAGRDVEYDLRALLLHRLHGLGAAFYRKMSAGEIMSRSTNDLTQVRLLTGFGILNIINVVFGLASALQVMLGISGKLTAASFVTLPMLVLMTRSFSKSLFARTRQNQDTLGKLSESLQTNLAGVRVVRSFALEQRELTRFRVANSAYLEASLGLARLRGSMQPMMGATSAVGILVFFWYGGTLLLRGPAVGGLTPGDFFAFSLALTRMMWPMVALGFALSIVQRGRAGHARLREVFEAIPEVSDGPNAPPAEVKGALRVEHLGFAYGDRTVLDDVSFTVPAGKSLAIVGRTGSGKS
ncbi:MAG: ABC transporter transmembrane domain-containing protein, partial [Polyangiaceae bacterium]